MVFVEASPKPDQKQKTKTPHRLNQRKTVSFSSEIIGAWNCSLFKCHAVPQKRGGNRNPAHQVGSKIGIAYDFHGRVQLGNPKDSYREDWGTLGKIRED